EERNMRKVHLCLIATLVLCSLSGMAQNQAGPPGGITLLPGYQHERLRGADSVVGRIWKDQGLSIRYDIGGLAGNRVTGNPNLQWSKEKIVSGNRVQMALTKDRTLIVVFSSVAPGPRGVPGSMLPANFYATVSNEEDIADMLFMV